MSAEPRPTRDRIGSEVLDVEECWRLVAAAPVGRVAVVADGSPVIMPVNHAVVGHSVVFLTAPGTKLGAAVMGRPAAFEVDAWNAPERRGWSVLIDGQATVVTDPAEIDRLAELGLEPWAGSPMQSEWIRIVPHDISGRRVQAKPRPEIGS